MRGRRSMGLAVSDATAAPVQGAAGAGSRPAARSFRRRSVEAGGVAASERAALGGFERRARVFGCAAACRRYWAARHGRRRCGFEAPWCRLRVVMQAGGGSAPGRWRRMRRAVAARPHAGGRRQTDGSTAVRGCVDHFFFHLYCSCNVIYNL